MKNDSLVAMILHLMEHRISGIIYILASMHTISIPICLTMAQALYRTPQEVVDGRTSCACLESH